MKNFFRSVCEGFKSGNAQEGIVGFFFFLIFSPSMLVLGTMGVMKAYALVHLHDLQGRALILTDHGWFTAPGSRVDWGVIWGTGIGGAALLLFGLLATGIYAVWLFSKPMGKKRRPCYQH